MNSLQSYISDNLNISDIDLRKTWVQKQLCEVYGSDVPDYVIERCEQNGWFDVCMVDENLQSHDSIKVFDKIRKEFPSEFVKCVRQKTESDKNYMRVYFKEPGVENTPRFNNILSFYGYFITDVNTDPDSEYWAIDIEPAYGEDMTDYIQNKCRGIIWHLTTRSAYEDIMKSGVLRVKHGSVYRRFPDRLYVYASPNPNTKKLSELAKTVVNGQDVIAIRINVSKLKIGFFEDPLMNNKEDVSCFYTLNSIPTKFFTGIKDIR